MEMTIDRDKSIENTKKMIISMIKCYEKSDYSEIEEILKSNMVDWGFFCEKVIKNKLENLAWIVMSRCSDTDETIPFYIREFFAKLYYLNKEKVIIFDDTFQKVAMAFEANDISYAVVKGLALENDLYGNDYVKRISDIDMIINKKDSDKVSKILASIGLKPARFEYATNTVIELPREKQLLFKMTGDHLPEHFDFTGEKVCPFIKVDISTSLDWINKKENSMIVFALKEGTVGVKTGRNHTIKTLMPAAHFIYMINHFYRHAWSYRFIQRNISIRLCMTNDIYMYWKKHNAEIKEKINSLVTDKTEKEKIAWVLYYMDRLYGCNILDELGLKDHVNNLNCAFGKNDTILKWKGTIEDRVFAYEEKDLMEASEG